MLEVHQLLWHTITYHRFHCHCISGGPPCTHHTLSAHATYDSGGYIDGRRRITPGNKPGKVRKDQIKYSRYKVNVQM
jgi:hypothetical protein